MTITRRLPISQISSQIEEAISTGQKLGERASDLSVLRTAFQTWDKRNEVFLGRAFEKSGFLESTPKDEYSNGIGLSYPFGLELADAITVERILGDIKVKTRRLNQVLETLDAYDGPEDDNQTEVDSGNESKVFIVHGRPPGPRLQVENLVRQATNSQPIVLADQIGGGAVTLIEKLEEHLGASAASSFAIIVMTADDLGRLDEDGENLQPRARQNVVLELGFAMGSLGRRKVAILHEDGLELPSDIVGVAYYPLDAAGAWKTRLLGELKAADIEVDANALIS